MQKIKIDDFKQLHHHVMLSRIIQKLYGINLFEYYTSTISGFSVIKKNKINVKNCDFKLNLVVVKQDKEIRKQKQLISDPNPYIDFVQATDVVGVRDYFDYAASDTFLVIELYKDNVIKDVIALHYNDNYNEYFKYFDKIKNEIKSIINKGYFAIEDGEVIEQNHIEELEINKVYEIIDFSITLNSNPKYDKKEKRYFVIKEVQLHKLHFKDELDIASGALYTTLKFDKDGNALTKQNIIRFIIQVNEITLDCNTLDIRCNNMNFSDIRNIHCNFKLKKVDMNNLLSDINNVKEKYESKLNILNDLVRRTL